KIQIAKRHLLPKQLEANGLKEELINFTDEGLHTITQYYTREAGVRNLEREIASVLRKLARKMLTSDDPAGYQEIVSEELVKELLGPTRFRPHALEEQSEVGLATGLAWTEVGGEVLHIEASLMTGRGNITLTGKLGEVMQESARAALSCVRARAKKLDLPADFYKKYDLHLHVPEGAIPKDGPSAGIAIATAIVSVLTQVAVRRDVAMTGEITLRGKVLPIGGVKEKLLAAHRAGITTIVLPKENAKDLVEVPSDVMDALTIHTLDNVDDVWRIALERPISRETATPEVPIWGQQQPGDSPTSNQAIDQV
ncbi:MAG TPA: S16 family serine protease, partial [Blastocatellia bacterium]|nr:S16 family serine protease [Blastocatellia bacterium]